MRSNSSIQLLDCRRCRFHFVYTPKHASWMNQIEIWFSILHRRILKYGSFDDPFAQKGEVEGYISASF